MSEIRIVNQPFVEKHSVCVELREGTISKGRDKKPATLSPTTTSSHTDIKVTFIFLQIESVTKRKGKRKSQGTSEPAPTLSTNLILSLTSVVACSHGRNVHVSPG
jgi:hypothetical protein